MNIMKFGGSSVKDAERIAAVVDIVRLQGGDRPVVVCSALGGITDQLIEAAHLAAGGDEGYLSVFNKIKNRHLGCATELLSGAALEGARVHIQAQLHSLEEVLRGIFLIQECTRRSKDLVMSFGERLSNYLVCEHLRTFVPGAVMLDARHVVKTDEQFGAAVVNKAQTYERIRNHSNTDAPVRVVTGFIGSTDRGETTTLGRGGSDYTAALFGAALGASEIQIWTDVDGVLATDPRIVPSAQTVSEMSYEEAMEMSHFGAKVIYPPTMQPALDAGIPIRIKNTFNPDAEGTLISSSPSPSSPSPVTGISTIKNIAFIRVHGTGLVGVTGTAGRMFSALSHEGVNIIMITQGSSEHSICFAVDPVDAERSIVAIRKEFALQIIQRQIEEIVVENGLSVVAVIGERMRQTPGISGRLFGTLGRHGLNVVAIAQGSSERNISIVVSADQVESVMTVIHEEFFEKTGCPVSDTQEAHEPVKVFLVGTGLIGSALLDQLDVLADKRIHLHGLMNSGRMMLSPRALRPSRWRQALEVGAKADLPSYIEELLKMNGKKIFVDCTASDKIPMYYPRLLSSGVRVVTPNKKAASGPQQHYDKLHDALCSGQMDHETNVGAGLPVIRTIRSLLATGDEILEVSGVFSGTLSYLFNTYDGTSSFAQLVGEARSMGFTEPDPRDDLSGMDVARKLVVLARELRMRVSLEDVSVENLTPGSCRSIQGVEAFLEALRAHDDAFAQQVQQAASQGKRLRYIGSIKAGKLSVSLEAVGPEHTAYGLSGSDNLIAFHTLRYGDRPLVIQGPGAGAQVTAAGVLAGLL